MPVRPPGQLRIRCELHRLLGSCGDRGALSRLMIRDTWNTDIANERTPEAGEAVIYKRRFCGFYKTGLHELL